MNWKLYILYVIRFEEDGEIQQEKAVEISMEVEWGNWYRNRASIKWNW